MLHALYKPAVGRQSLVDTRRCGGPTPTSQQQKKKRELSHRKQEGLHHNLKLYQREQPLHRYIHADVCIYKHIYIYIVYIVHKRIRLLTPHDTHTSQQRSDQTRDRVQQIMVHIRGGHLKTTAPLIWSAAVSLKPQGGSTTCLYNVNELWMMLKSIVYCEEAVYSEGALYSRKQLCIV